jgi:hypothetical protein
MHVIRRIPSLPGMSLRCQRRRGLIALVGLLFTIWVEMDLSLTAQETTRPEEGLIIAVDASLSMQKKLPAVKRAVRTLVDGLDSGRQYHVVLVRFGTVVEQVVALDLDGIEKASCRHELPHHHSFAGKDHLDDLVVGEERQRR